MLGNCQSKVGHAQGGPFDLCQALESVGADRHGGDTELLNLYCVMDTP